MFSKESAVSRRRTKTRKVKTSLKKTKNKKPSTKFDGNRRAVDGIFLSLFFNFGKFFSHIEL